MSDVFILGILLVVIPLAMGMWAVDNIGTILLVGIGVLALKWFII